MILKIGVYCQTGTDWQKAVKSSGEPFPDTYLTMQNGRVSFTLLGYATYNEASAKRGLGKVFGGKAEE